MPKDKSETASNLLVPNAEDLFLEYTKTKDPKIRNALVAMHANLVNFLASKFANRGEQLDDLIQVGNIGLIHAIDRYDPSRGTKFVTYATPTIIGEIRRYFRDRTWSLKVPRHLQKLNVAASKAIETLSQELERPPTVEEISKMIDATEEETIEALEIASVYEAYSLDAKIPYDNMLTQLEMAESIGHIDESIQRLEEYGDLDDALDSLESREKSIIYLRFFNDMSQTEVARKLNISQMHVSRLQQRALRRLKELLSK